jgi:hypothetical protein
VELKVGLLMPIPLLTIVPPYYVELKETSKPFKSGENKRPKMCGKGE